jgi:predicted nucleic acid-binding protein
MSALVDTDILIDALRGMPAAETWLTSQSTTPFAIPGIVAMELMAGCRNQAELRQLQRFLSRFTIAWTEAAECAQAYDFFATHWLAAKLSIRCCPSVW